MQKKQKAFLKKLSGYLAFSYFHKYCYTLTKNSDEITQSNLQRLTASLSNCYFNWPAWLLVLYFASCKACILKLTFIPFYVMIVLYCLTLLIFIFLVTIFFNSIFKNLTNYYYSFIYLFITQPTTDNLWYLRVVF